MQVRHKTVRSTIGVDRLLDVIHHTETWWSRVARMGSKPDSRDVCSIQLVSPEPRRGVPEFVPTDQGLFSSLVQGMVHARLRHPDIGSEVGALVSRPLSPRQKATVPSHDHSGVWLVSRLSLL